MYLNDRLETKFTENWDGDYNSSIGRFISEDPIGLGSFDSNLFRYVSNSPINSFDPMGWQNNPVGGFGAPLGGVFQGIAYWLESEGDQRRRDQKIEITKGLVGFPWSEESKKELQRRMRVCNVQLQTCQLDAFKEFIENLKRKNTELPCDPTKQSCGEDPIKKILDSFEDAKKEETNKSCQV
ncbi:MAG: hypothetical protein NXH75_05820 [Halobacteriovoraceae bacterium]|nr:hypothetical protein [Halobacteriovoraceae bacterium]